LRGTVDFTYVRRWPVALPQTSVGVYQRIAEFTSSIDPTSRIQFAGDYLSQTGQNTAVAWGNRAAANLDRHHGHWSHTGDEEFAHG
jgi:protoporphyrinogen oxidase